MNEIQKNIVESRIEELRINQGDTVTDPIYCVWQCKKCNNQELGIIGIYSDADVTMKLMYDNLKNNPISLISEVPRCNCSFFRSPKMELSQSIFCTFSDSKGIDLQIHNFYKTRGNVAKTNVYFMKLTGECHKLTVNEMSSMFGL